MPRNPRLYLNDIEISCTKVMRYANGLSFEQFIQDEIVYDAVLRNLEIIGEAVKNIPEDIRTGHTEIEWRKVSGFRDIVVHEYFSIDHSIVWDIVKNKIPALKMQIDRILDGWSS